MSIGPIYLDSKSLITHTTFKLVKFLYYVSNVVVEFPGDNFDASFPAR